MNRTLLFKLMNLDHYKTSNPNGARQLDWKSDDSFFNEMNVGDSAIGFTIQKGRKTIKALIGTISAKDEKSKLITITNVMDYEISTVNLLMKLNSMKPELIPSMTAGYFQYQMHDREIDIDAVKKELSSEQFINFFILKSENELGVLKPQLKTNDRVAVFKDNRFEKLTKFDGNKLVDFHDYSFCVGNLSLDEMISKNQSKTVPKKANINLLKSIKDTLASSPYYKFSHFIDYQNVLLNKTAYGDQQQIKPPTQTNDQSSNKAISKHSFNTILFGPPGTGKTYHSINLAVEIADPQFMKGIQNRGTQRDQIKERYDELVKDGRIVFTTFHQSMCYEDFIEGIKPMKPEDDPQLKYDVADGVFKRINTRAMYHLYKKHSGRGADQPRDTQFEAVYNQLISKIEAKKGSAPYQFTTKSGQTIQLVDVSDSDNLLVKHKGSVRDKPYTVSRNRLMRLFLEFDSIEQIKNVNNDIKRVIGGSNSSAFYAVLWELFKLEKSMDKSETASSAQVTPDNNAMKIALERFQLSRGWEASLSDPPDNYVLIIDEINRGNVSQIFGELITLIEDDKRAGKNEALQATLPYSGESFRVAPNLYIIGTMNTADRSVEALDTALRRRFTFEETLPKDEIPDDDGTDLMEMPLCKHKKKDILSILNKRIKLLLDRDHQIGHSYLLGLETDEDLMETFSRKIIPLLQEYFYGDYARIGLVLGKGFVVPDRYDVKDLAPFAYDDKESLIRESYQIREFDDIVDFGKALDTMMGKPEYEQQEQA